jgi:hypothetical protein
MTDPLRLELGWPTERIAPFREELFWGAWHPERELQISWRQAGAKPEVSIAAGRNWFLAGSVAPDGRGVVHDGHLWSDRTEMPSPAGLAFRGYLLDASLHSGSPSRALLEYWADARTRERNGVFAAAGIARDGTVLELVTDAFGIAPLYWRREQDGLIMFSTSPRLLRKGGDAVDGLAERVLFARGALVGDLSLLNGVARVSPGSVLRFDGAGFRSTSWFDFASLPPGDEPITEQGLALAEDVFQQAIDRCLALLPQGPHDLPLSSGDDSRRILAALQGRQVLFRAVTVRVLQKGNRDLDARFSSEMAAVLGFDHKILELPTCPVYAGDDARGRALLSSEVSEHTWFLGLARELGGRRSLVFDGLAGDIVGNTGFGLEELHRASEEEKLSLVARLALSDAGETHLRTDSWTPLRVARDYLTRSLEFLPSGVNRADLAFLLIRARRGTGPCTQHLLQAGQMPVYPYLDLDHVRVTLALSSIDKLQQTLQARCLQRFWPQYYAFGGSRRIPEGIPEGASGRNGALTDARVQQLQRESGGYGSLGALSERLTPRAMTIAVAALTSRRVRARTAWWLDPVLVSTAFARQDVAWRRE